MADIAELSSAVRRVPLAHRVLACLAPSPAATDSAAEARWLAALSQGQPQVADADEALARWRESPPTSDARLHRLCAQLGLASIETLAVALALAVDQDPMVARAVGWLQGIGNASHPSLGLLGCLAGGDGPGALVELLDGQAVASGLLLLEGGDGSLQQASLRVPTPLLLSLCGGQGCWPQARLLEGPPQVLAAGTLAALHDEARALLLAGAGLVIRSGHPQESRAAARSLAMASGRAAAVVDLPAPAGLGPWLRVHDALPLVCAELQPGERSVLPRLPGYEGPWLVATGPDGSWAVGDEAGTGQGIANWNLPLPAAGERAALWRRAGAQAPAAEMLGARHRHSAARIAALARAARGHAGDDGGRGFGLQEVAHAARGAGRGELGALAELLPGDVDDAALVLPEPVRADLELLTARCHARDGLADSLGPATRARYHPGVRALLVGPSGTGKTLASAWLATRLGLPLYRVDVASVSSKYIGETEKNLGELFARAEHADVVLLFDEADSLFGKRTDVKDANDRFANQQTNYLLQRIESFDGIVLLTSNARGRFDGAFTRRLDAVLEFPLPLPPQRRALWMAHLGDAHAIDGGELNRLAGECELAGGHIRNIALAARALAGSEPIGWAHLVPAMRAEYRKIGRPLPSGIGVTSGRD